MAELQHLESTALNGSRFAYVDGEYLIRTHASSGGFSGLIPMRIGDGESGSAELTATLELERGAMSVAAVDQDLNILNERFFREPGVHQIALLTPDVRKVRGFLVRNARGAPFSEISSIGRLYDLNLRESSAPMFSMKQSGASRELTLPVRRRPQPSRDHEADRVAADHVSEPTAFMTHQIAVMVIDAWEQHPSKSYTERSHRNIEENLGPALDAFRRLGVLIIHAPHDFDVHKRAAPLPGETLLEGGVSAPLLASELRRRGVHTLFYMGYASNYCILNRPVGLIAMQAQKFRSVFVRDASIALETPESYEGFWAHRMAVSLIEGGLGAGSVSTRDVIKAVDATLAAEAITPRRNPGLADQPHH